MAKLSDAQHRALGNVRFGRWKHNNFNAEAGTLRSLHGHGLIVKFGVNDEYAITDKGNKALLNGGVYKKNRECK